jgi:hypothetical protein
MGQFMKKSFYIQLLRHIGIEFNQELTGTIRFSHNIAITINMLTAQTTMMNLYINLMAWEKPIQKPSGNVLTEAFRITVSRIRDVRH